jgi:hypothetical protein
MFVWRGTADSPFPNNNLSRLGDNIKEFYYDFTRFIPLFRRLGAYT